MFRKRKLIRVFAIFFLMEMLLDIGYPLVSYALTSGPTAPEVSSFEPVDTTDLVNLLTGDFNYNMPLLEVPGPAGGYPLSLSYHAGIKNGQEASWTGLGWNINPGSINRSTHGFADDALGDEYKVLDYSDGGETVTNIKNYNLSLPGTSNFSPSVGMTFSESNDTYKGFSSTSSPSLTISGGIVGTGIGPVSGGVGYGVSFSDQGGSASIGVQSSINSAFDNSTLLNSSASISSRGLKTSTTVGNGVSSFNSSAGRLSSFSKKDVQSARFGPLGITIGKYYQRYWSIETSTMKTYGSLHASSANTHIENDYLDNGNNKLITHSFDLSDLYDDRSTDVKEEANPALQLGGTFLSYDDYQVTGQGISGSIQPYVAENGDLFGQNYYLNSLLTGNSLLNSPIMQYKSLGKTFDIDKVDFRFLGDYSNNVNVTPSDINYSNLEFNTGAHAIDNSAKGLKLTSNEQHLAGSKNVEWYTNEAIRSGEAKKSGFIDYYANPLDRKISYEVYENGLQPEAMVPYCLSSIGGPLLENEANSGYHEASLSADIYCEDDEVILNCSYRYKTLKPTVYDINDKIGGFKVTNETGVTYHYALPVYNYNEYSRTRLKETRADVPEHRETFNRTPYAYTWLLTAVTGPDYVDKNDNGSLDDSDWGYWVKFDYGLWTDSYQWRTPQEGYTHDISSDAMSFTYGLKELYYLDAVETRSHIALFAKSKRKDGKGVTSRLEGGSNPRQFVVKYQDAGVDIGEVGYYVAPVSTMKLDAIYLLDKENYERLDIRKDAGDKYNDGSIASPHKYYYQGQQVTVPTGPDITTADYVQVKYHNGDLVLDDDDIKDLLDASDGLRESSIRIVELNYDYSLSDGMPNSMLFLSDLIDVPESHNELLYPNGFDIEVPNEDFANQVDPSSLDRICGAGCFNMYGSNSKYTDDWLCGSTDNVIESGGKNLDFYYTGRLTLKSLELKGKSGINVTPPYQFEYANNPDFHEQEYDKWGYYKSDYQGSVLPASVSSHRQGDGQLTPNDPSNESRKALTPYSREVTSSSSENVDAWSLTKIITPLGADINIDYESDEYFSVLNNPIQYEIESIERLDTQNRIAVKMKEKNSSFFRNLQAGDVFSMKALVVNAMRGGGLTLNSNLAEKEIINSNFSVISINGDELIIESPNLYELLTLRTIDRDGVSYSVLGYLISGFASRPNNDSDSFYGGGLRVSKISLTDGITARQQWTSYSYNDPTTALTTGSTSFQPYNAIQVSYDVHNDFFFESLRGEDIDLIQQLDEARHSFQIIANEASAKLQSVIGEVPSPTVMYGTVTVQNGTDNLSMPYNERYYHTTFDESMVDKSFTSYSFGTFQHTRAEQLKLKNLTHRVGNLEKYERLDSNDKLLSRVTNNYLLDDQVEPFETEILANKQGVIEQSAHKYFRSVKYYFLETEPEDYPWQRQIVHDFEKAIVSQRSDHTDVMTSTVTEDFVNGTLNKTEYLQYDFFSGATLRTRTSDSYGNLIVSESTPAYHVYPGMGLMINGGNNMLTQEAASKTYLKKDEFDTNPLLISAGAQTWSDQSIFKSDRRNAQPIEIEYVSTNASGNHMIKVISAGVVLDPSDILKFEANENGWHYKGNVIAQLSGDRYEIKVPSIQLIGEIEKSLALTHSQTYSVSIYNAPLNHSKFSFIGDNQGLGLDDAGLLPLSSLNEFDSWGPSEELSSEQWQKNSEITLYDAYSHALEAKDINDNYAATRMDIEQEKVLATVANSRYKEFDYFGLEELNAGSSGILSDFVNYGFGDVSDDFSHTGVHSLKDNRNGRNGFELEIPNNADIEDGTYTIKVWVKTNNVADAKLAVAYCGAGGSQTTYIPIDPSKRSGDWYLLDYTFNYSSGCSVVIQGYNSGNGTLYWDDFRFHPTDAAMTSYVYNEWDELSHILDANNIYTKFEYDAMGRLIRTYRETFDYDEVQTGFSDYKYNISGATNLEGTISARSKDNGELRTSDDVVFGFNSNLPGTKAYLWDFGDGSTSASSNPEHKYSKADDYTVIVKVTDGETGLHFETKDEISIRACPNNGVVLRTECNGDGTQVRDIIADGKCGMYNGPWRAVQGPLDCPN